MNTNPRRAVLYTRKGCCLCDDARDVLERHGFEVESIDIDGDETLRERYGRVIPVVWIDGRERFRGRIEPALLQRLLRARP